MALIVVIADAPFIIATNKSKYNFCRRDLIYEATQTTELSTTVIYWLYILKQANKLSDNKNVLKNTQSNALAWVLVQVISCVKSRYCLFAHRICTAHRHNWFKCRDVRKLIYSDSAYSSLKHTITAANFYSIEYNINNDQSVVANKISASNHMCINRATNWASLN